MKNWEKSRNYRRIKDENGVVISNLIVINGVEVEVSTEIYEAYSTGDRHERYQEEQKDSVNVSKDNALKISRLPAEQQAAAAELLTTGKIRKVEEFITAKYSGKAVEPVETEAAEKPPAENQKASAPPGKAAKSQSDPSSSSPNPPIKMEPLPSKKADVESFESGQTESVASDKPMSTAHPSKGGKHSKKASSSTEGEHKGSTAEDDPPFTLGGKQFATVRESIADLKDPNKDCSARPDTFLAEINAFVEKFDEEVDWFRNPYYLTAISKLSQIQFEYFSRRMETIHGTVKQIIQYVEGEWSKHE